MKSIYKLFLFTVIFFSIATNLNGASIQNKYFYAKKNYSVSILSGNKSKEIKYLKELIKYGDVLSKDTRLYKSKLKKYKLPSKIKKIVFKNENETKKSKYFSISSISATSNSIIINFKHKISKSYIKFNEERIGKFVYDIFDFKGNFKDANPIKLKIKGVSKIWISQIKEKKLRIKLKSVKNLKTVYIINKKSIIIKILNLKNKIIPISKKKIIKENNVFNQKTIVIDPGHGGRDAGAPGPRNKYEKTSVLKISKYLYKMLKKKGFKVYLTRTKDKYVSLKKRTNLANDKKADIFISIHANSIAKSRAKKTKGIETYFLSPARSNRSKRVAAKENSGDINGLSYSSKDIVLTLLNRGKITASQKMAIDIQSYMLHELKKNYGELIIDKGVREGPFWVLVGAQMPSVLIEVGYISHPQESNRLYSTRYQKAIAKGISDGILSYFSKNN